MPVMTKMRDSMPVVFAALAGIFLLMIIFQWGGQGMIFNKSSDAETLGLVNGQKITQREYNKMYASAVAELKSKDKTTENLNEAGEEQASEDAWDKSVEQAIMNESIEKMGLAVTDQEVRDMIFSNPAADVKKQFTDSTGVFHEDAYFKALRDPKNDSLVRTMEAETRDMLLKYKWQQAMVSSVRVTDTEAYLRYMTDSAKAFVQVVKFLAPANHPAGNVTDKEIQDYYDSHSWMYKQAEQRKFKFVTFPLVPNARDTALALETANSIAGKLADAPLENIDTVAKEISEDYTDAPPEPRHVVVLHDIGDDTSLFHTKVGDVAVARLKNKITALRVLQLFDTGLSFFKVRAIEIGYPPGAVTHSQSTIDSTKAVADQIVAQLKAGANFAELARTRSSDPRTAKTGGEMGWIDTGTFPPNSRAIIGHAATGEVVGPIESARGYEIILSEGSSQKAWAIIGIPLTVKPSHQTLLMEEQMAGLFKDAAQKTGFDQAASAGGYHVINEAPAATKKGAPIFGSNVFRDWIFQSAKGDVSPPFKLTKQNFILVAQVSDIVPTGSQPLAAVKSRIAEEIALKKAVASLEAKAKQFAAQIGPAGDLTAAAAASGDASLTPFSVLMGPAESVQGLPTSEYVVNNWAFSAQPGTISPPLKGEHGYYVVKLLGRNIPSQKDFEATKPAIVKGVLQEKEQRLMLDWIQNQKEKATLVDYRTPLNGSR
jgi:peptidyl-prolyl cis-trans isomerase D